MHLHQIQSAAAYLQARSIATPKIGLILGSGLGVLAEHIEGAISIPFQDIPHFPVSTVGGHAGQWVMGTFQGQQVVAMQGRIHFYEGYSMQQVTFPVRVMRALGVETLLVTNAVGGLHPALRTGMFMFIKDHINLMGDNPLRGENHAELGPRFPDMSNAYDPALLALGQRTAAALGIETHTGVYVAVSGPTFETAAEMRYLQIIGADAVGMSVVPETLVAVHGGMKVLGISCITDVPRAETEPPLTHEEVMAAAAAARPDFIRLVSGIVAGMG